ncbi:MAG TPA: ATPase domain-containing protein [Longimicrobiaceae bacterium]|nr:ATPase domain-containing protein [Longimicrobiaceae bacterium]
MGDGTNGGGNEGTAGVAQVRTGVPGLDRLLNGGLRRGGLHVVLGGPGAGKSVLAHQIGAQFVREGGKVLYLTALVETHQMLIAQARTFPFFDPAFVPGSFYYASLYPVLARGGLQAVREEIGRLVALHGPSLVVLDGVHALKVSAEDPLDYQRFMHEMEAQAAVTDVTTLLLTHPEEGMSSDPTFTIADAIFHLRTEEVRLREVRMFSVGKLRGVGHVRGWHTFRITAEGIHLYPRLESLAATMETTLSGEAMETPPAPLAGFTVEGLDDMLGGGLERSTVSLLVGTPGAGKTMLGLAFLSAGAEAGEPGLLVGFHEAPESLLRKADGVSLPFRKGIADGKIHIHWRSPSETLADDVAERTLAFVEEHGIERVVFDAIEDVRHSIIPRERDFYYFAALASLLRERGVTTLFLQDLPRIVGMNFDLPLAELSAVMDNVLHARYVERKGELLRLFSVLKIRARSYDHALRAFHITGEGMRVGEPFEHSEMVLTGLALPRDPQSR